MCDKICDESVCWTEHNGHMKPLVDSVIENIQSCHQILEFMVTRCVCSGGQYDGVHCALVNLQ